MISGPGPEIMAVEYKFYRPKRILNRHKHPDHWFWTHYTAHASTADSHTDGQPGRARSADGQPTAAAPG